MSFPRDFKFPGLKLIKALDKAITKFAPSLAFHSIVIVKK